MQGAGHAREASHAIGASELGVILGMDILLDQTEGASYEMGASELAVFSTDHVVGSKVMVVRIFASQSDEVIFGSTLW